MLVVFGGLPGVGKTTIAREVSARRRATYLRVDAIEGALRASGALAGEVGPSGYLVAYAVADANLALGGIVVADSVNPWPETRAAWRAVAAARKVPAVEVEIVCSDPEQHRRQAQDRLVDVPGLVPPTWEAILRHDYRDWPEPHLIVDTAGLTLEEAVSHVLAAMHAA